MSKRGLDQRLLLSFGCAECNNTADVSRKNDGIEGESECKCLGDRAAVPLFGCEWESNPDSAGV